MRCGAARKHLYLLNRRDSEQAAHPAPAEAEQAEAHVEGCPACREFFASEERMKNLISKRAPREKASAELRERILSRIASRGVRAGPRPGMPSRRLLALMLAVPLAVIVLAAGLWLNERRGRAVMQQLASTLVEDHTHNLSRGVDIAASDGGALRSWFQGKVDFAFRLPAAHDSSLIGGRLCNLQGRRAALILYSHRQSNVSLFIFEGSNLELPEDHLIALDSRRCFVETKKGYTVVMWNERDLIYGLVSDLSSADLLQLAAQF